MIIPALDLLGGKIVRLKQGDYSRTTYFDADPVKKILDAANREHSLSTSWIWKEPVIL